LCSEILNKKDVNDETYAAILDRFGELIILDILVTAGYFGFVSVILNTICQPVPEDGVQLPKLKEGQSAWGRSTTQLFYSLRLVAHSPDQRCKA